jgi:hypothetical protein
VAAQVQAVFCDLLDFSFKVQITSNFRYRYPEQRTGRCSARRRLTGEPHRHEAAGCLPNDTAAGPHGGHQGDVMTRTAPIAIKMFLGTTRMRNNGLLHAGRALTSFPLNWASPWALSGTAGVSITA